MRYRTLDAWLDWQSSLNPEEIDLGLDRVSAVLQRLGYASRFRCPLIMVAGTNGKGSVVAMIEALALAAGLNVGTYTSPHLYRYNERIRLNGKAIDDAPLCQAFERVDQARRDVALTYFEFGTLAAIDLFQQQSLDLIVMEVGLGGRLDAVNVMDADVAIITPIAIDHVDWLGDNREAIGSEKAGIIRDQATVICADPEPPASLLAAADKAARFYRLGDAFTVERQNSAWTLTSSIGQWQALPPPALHGDFQYDNAAAAIMALQVLASDDQPGFELKTTTLAQGLSRVQLQGRYQVLQSSPLVITDVAHNPHAMTSLVEMLKASPVAGQTRVVIAMLADKPISEAVNLLSSVADYWYTAGLEQENRGLSADKMSAIVAQVSTGDKLCATSTVDQAIAAALEHAKADDRIVITGSFYTVAQAGHYFSALQKAS